MAIGASKPPLAVIAGPTASGKSALALALAEASGGVIVNADSAQIYRDLPILSAAPTTAERSIAEHRLYGVRDGALPCSAAEWAALARREIEDVHAGGRLPILVGGTGLYLRTLLEGIAPIPAIDPEIRRKVRERSVAQNRFTLEQTDPEAAAKLDAADAARTARALEVVLSTGQPLRHWHQQREGGISEAVDLRAGILLPPRDWLYARCDHRFSAMVDDGAEAEVQALLARGLNPQLPVMRAIGVRELAQRIAGQITAEQAIAAGQQATRNYAKRQYTWFAHQPPPNWRRISAPLSDPAVLVDTLSLLHSA